ncbi:MAG: hypothetical protein K2G83_01620, partial [Ruminococcus sp.]|nr:hypothetical protein [Ruminococcus sp.]
HNIDIPVSDINHSNEGVLLDVILELMKAKVASSSKKVVLAKFAPNTRNQILSDSDAKKIYELNEHNFELKNSDEFAALLDKFFKELTATVADPGKGRVLRTDDEGRLRRKAMQVNSSVHETDSSSTKRESTSEHKRETENNVGSFFDSLFD